MDKTYQTIEINPSIFRAYDIRGLVDLQLNENVYFTIGLALAHILKNHDRHKIAIAWDGRLSSWSYAHALEQALGYQNIQVTLLGMVPTACMYYATHYLDMDCGLMVTGSHNPKEYNGLKMVLAGQTAQQEQIQEIWAQTQKLDKGLSVAEQNYHPHEVDIVTPYIQEILGDVHLSRPLKVIADFGHGVGAGMGPELFKKLGCELISLYDTVDGNFPAHHPDPTIPKNLEDLQKSLKIYQADIGLAFDGDADRLGVVTPEGEIIWPDRIMLILARDVLKRKPHAKIVYDVKCSKQLKEGILQAGGQAIMSPTGHSLVKGIMRTEKAELAGEMSGHIFFKERWYGFDDGLYSACRLLEILSQFPTTEALFATLPPTPITTPELKIEIAEDKKFQFMLAFAESAKFEEAEIITIDGLRLEFKNGWGLLRASNTSPCLVSRFEAQSEADLVYIQALFKQEIHKIDASLILPF